MDAVTSKGDFKLSVCGRATVAVSKIADACERSARSGQPVELEWGQEELPEGYSFDVAEVE